MRSSPAPATHSAPAPIALIVNRSRSRSRKPSAIRLLNDTQRGIQLRRLLEAERSHSKALEAWDLEQYRVQALYPPCPEGIFAGADRRRVPSAEQCVQADIAAGRLKKSSPIVAAFKKWKAACEAIDNQHLDRSLERAEKEAEALVERLDRQFRTAPVKSLADVRAKLEYILHYEDFSDPRSRKVAQQLKRLIPAWECVSW